MHGDWLIKVPIIEFAVHLPWCWVFWVVEGGVVGGGGGLLFGSFERGVHLGSPNADPISDKSM